MSFITVGVENSTEIDLFYEDHGTGQPIILIHGYPLNGRSWEKQVPALLEAGYRVITYDRRGFGQSSQPTIGYDYDTFAADLSILISDLELNNVILVGFSMGTGEVGRYLGTYGSDRIAKAIFLAPLQPYLIDSTTGVPQSVFDGILAEATADRFAHYAGFLQNFYNADIYEGTDRLSAVAKQHSLVDAFAASAFATRESIKSWTTDFRADIAKIDVPTLIVQGTADHILPIDHTGRPFRDLFPAATYIEIEDAPHGMAWTHAAELNQILLEWLAN
jgi:non-heme chloroperoxidase